MNKRQSIPFIVLLLAFLLWLYFKPQSNVIEAPKYQLNYIINGASNTHFDETGNMEYKISAIKTTGLSDDDITIFEHPKLTVYINDEKKDNLSVWQISSEKGILSKQSKLLLSDNVLVKNLTEDQLIQTMETEKLTILLDKKELNTDQLVTWKGPQMEQQGIGMWGSLVTEELIVKDQIKAVYFNENK
ncbi:LPS export ABC transporter periplasmic protein LptC [Psychromonas sp. PT13]|uniref:LPS export ABC transporter periplasmic protein LptC n=1 Tax=Psychromonas sp. PT13 TaxID=3439547 RepID=UPI003EC067CB